MNLEHEKKFQVLKIILEIDQFDNLGVWELYPILRTIFSSIITKIVCRKKTLWKLLFYLYKIRNMSFGGFGGLAIENATLMLQYSSSAMTYFSRTHQESK